MSKKGPKGGQLIPPVPLWALYTHSSATYLLEQIQNIECMK